jgi:armadillo repeat-containing protein 8
LGAPQQRQNSPKTKHLSRRELPLLWADLDSHADLVNAILSLVHCLNNVETIAVPEDIRLEAATIISSLSYGSEKALTTLLRTNALGDVMYALSRMDSSTSPVKVALVRAMKSIANALAEIVGPQLWWLGPDRSSLRQDAADSLSFLFDVSIFISNEY